MIHVSDDLGLLCLVFCYVVVGYWCVDCFVQD